MFDPCNAIRVAQTMANIFEDNLNDDGFVIAFGFEQLNEIFREVPLQYRAEVFNLFLHELDTRDILFDEQAFQGTG